MQKSKSQAKLKPRDSLTVTSFLSQANDVAKLIYELQWNNEQEMTFERTTRVLELYTVNSG